MRCERIFKGRDYEKENVDLMERKSAKVSLNLSDSLGIARKTQPVDNS